MLRLNVGVFLILAALRPVASHAAMSSDWDVSLGATSLSYSYSSLVAEKIESTSLLELSYNLANTQVRSALNLSFTEIYNGDKIPYTRIALGIRHYFNGFNGERVIYDSATQAKLWRTTPFVAVNAGFSNLSVEGFNASFVDASLRGGVEVPLVANALLVGQVSVSSSLTSNSSIAKVTYSAITLYAGLRFNDL